MKVSARLGGADALAARLVRRIVRESVLLDGDFSGSLPIATASAGPEAAVLRIGKASPGDPP